MNGPTIVLHLDHLSTSPPIFLGTRSTPEKVWKVWSVSLWKVISGSREIPRSKRSRGISINVSPRLREFGHGIKKHLAREAPAGERNGREDRHTWSLRFACPSRFSETRSPPRNERARTCENLFAPSPLLPRATRTPPSAFMQIVMTASSAESHDHFTHVRIMARWSSPEIEERIGNDRADQFGYWCFLDRHLNRLRQISLSWIIKKQV